MRYISIIYFRGYAFNSTADFELITEIKEKYCFASGDIRVDRKLARETTCHEIEHKLPDGSKIKIGKERYNNFIYYLDLKLLRYYLILLMLEKKI